MDTFLMPDKEIEHQFRCPTCKRSPLYLSGHQLVCHVCTAIYNITITKIARPPIQVLTDEQLIERAKQKAAPKQKDKPEYFTL